MSEVDYSRFVYKRENQEGNAVAGSATEEREVPSERAETNYTPPTFSSVPSKKKKKRSFLFAFFVIFLCFALILLAVDIFSNGKVVQVIRQTLSKNDYEYYVVAAENRNNEMAYTKSLTVKQGGGAGYIYNTEEKIYVVFSPYTDMSSAEKVSAKNTDTVVLSLGRKGKNSFFTKMDGCFKEMCEAVKAYDEGVLTDSDFNGKKEKVRLAVAELQRNENLSDEKKNLCLFVLSGLDEMKVNLGVKSEFLSSARYFLTGWVISICK